ncbi:MAG: hypothetical protein ACOYLQ_13350 [Hyphomicrobiaceae bacterium]
MAGPKKKAISEPILSPGFLPSRPISTDPITDIDATRDAAEVSKAARSAWGFSRTLPKTDPLEDAIIFVRQLQTRYDLSRDQILKILSDLAASFASSDATIRDQPPLPDTAPEAWAGRDLNRRETAPDFIRRVYGPWIGRGLTRKLVKQRDPDLYRALSVWLTRHPDDAITQVLPKQSELLDDLIDRLSSEFTLEELRKLGYAVDARLKRQKKA